MRYFGIITGVLVNEIEYLIYKLYYEISKISITSTIKNQRTPNSWLKSRVCGVAEINQ